MNEVFTNIISKFEKINKKGYIKGITNNLYNGAGMTFEFLIGKNADSLFFPDYYGVEIKTTQRFSRHPITLFTTAFDGPSFYEANYLLEKYGRQDDTYNKRKILITSLYFNRPRCFGDYYFDLGIDHNKQNIYINIYNKKLELLEKRGFINFSTLKEKLEIKLKYLCVVYASKKTINDDLYFRYYKIECYLLKNFEEFINLMENNELSLSLMLRISRSPAQAGIQKNKNLIVAISRDKLELLFDKIYSYEK